MKKPRKRAAARRTRTPARRVRPALRRSAPRQRYTEALLANARHRWEETAEATRTIAADLGIVPTSLNRLARERGWVRRNPPPPRDLPSALKIEEEAKAAAEAAADAGIAADPVLEADLPAFHHRAAGARGAAELATIEAMRDALGTLPQPPPKGNQTARTLASLTQHLAAPPAPARGPCARAAGRPQDRR